MIQVGGPTACCSPDWNCEHRYVSGRVRSGSKNMKSVGLRPPSKRRNHVKMLNTLVSLCTRWSRFLFMSK